MVANPEIATSQTYGIERWKARSICALFIEIRLLCMALNVRTVECKVDDLVFALAMPSI